MRQNNPLNYKSSTPRICTNCHGLFRCNLTETKDANNGQDLKYIKCPWCDYENKMVTSVGNVSVHTSKIEN
jgi:hypothetical protein